MKACGYDAHTTVQCDHKHPGKEVTTYTETDEKKAQKAR